MPAFLSWPGCIMLWAVCRHLGFRCNQDKVGDSWLIWGWCQCVIKGFEKVCWWWNSHLRVWYENKTAFNMCSEWHYTTQGWVFRDRRTCPLGLSYLHRTISRMESGMELIAGVVWVMIAEECHAIHLSVCCYAMLCSNWFPGYSHLFWMSPALIIHPPVLFIPLLMVRSSILFLPLMALSTLIAHMRYGHCHFPTFTVHINYQTTLLWWHAWLTLRSIMGAGARGCHSNQTLRCSVPWHTTDKQTISAVKPLS